MKLRVQDERGPGKRLFERTVKHVKGDKGSTLTGMGVSG